MLAIKKGDLIVIAVVCLIALGLLGVRALPVAAGGRLLRISQDNRIVKEIPLHAGLSETLTIAIPGGEAIVEIADGRVRMLPMSKSLCPQGICSHVGSVQKPGDAIVCLPNRLVLTVARDRTEEELDGVTQ